MAQTDFIISKTKFKHLLFSDCVLIAFMLNEGYTQTRIAQELGVTVPRLPGRSDGAVSLRSS